jgi:EF-hand domain pair
MFINSRIGRDKPRLDHTKSIGHVDRTDLNSIRHAFATFDKDGSGTIDAEELYACLKAMGHHPEPLELEELLAQMDTNGDGVIDFDEFSAVMTIRKGVRYSCIHRVYWKHLIQHWGTLMVLIYAL